MDYTTVERILKTLPVGYYLGKNIEVRLDTGRESYYDPMDQYIVIGFGMLPLDKINDSDPLAEEIVRGVLYHEISHAILTPREMRMDTVLNIFEDQRIETLLKTFYMNVDFPKNLRLINHHTTPSAPETADEMFYDVVRYGEGPKQFIDRVYEIIGKYSDLTNAPITALDAYEDRMKIRDYEHEVYALYRDIRKLFAAAESMACNRPNELANEIKSKMPTSSASKLDNDKESKPNPSSASETKKIGSENNESDSENTENNEPLSLTEKECRELAAKIIEELEKTAPEYRPATPEETTRLANETAERVHDIVDAAIKKGLNMYCGTEIAAKIMKIVENSIKKRGRTASAMTAYSGRLDPRQIHKLGKPEDYKWWTKQNPNGQFARFSALRLNLFCDVSGSFRTSQKKLNELIKALVDIERRLPNFTVNIVKCGDTNKIASKTEREVACCGGNSLTYDIVNIYKRLQDPTAMTYNLVVFDGESQYGLKRDSIHKKAWSAWNHSNCYIVSDTDNEDRIKKLCSKANYTIVREDYAEHFEENVLKALKQMFR